MQQGLSAALENKADQNLATGITNCLNCLTVEDLEVKLQQLGIRLPGVKGDLVARLEAFMAQETKDGSF